MSATNPRIYLSPPHMSGGELDLVRQAFESNWIAPLGPHVDAFENEFASYVGVPHAAALSSGTAALHLALRMLNVQPGDEVLCSSFSFCASANAAVYQGALPVFIDSESESWNLNPDLLEEELQFCKKRGKMPRALISVDLYGQTAEYDRINGLCESYGVPVVEDAAEALGATYRGKQAGNFGVISVFSFNGNKIITTSGGGMLVSHDPKYVSQARFLSTQARDPAPHYQHSTIGYNYRMSNILAAIGRAQLKVLPERIEARRKNFEFYKRTLGRLPGIDFMPEPEGFVSTRWLSCMIVDREAFGATPEQIRIALENENIEARPLWKPLHLQPVYAQSRIRGGEVSASLFERGLCLPSGSNLTSENLNRIAEIIHGLHRP